MSANTLERGTLRGKALDAFLNLPLIGRLACHDRTGWPYVVPLWYDWDGAGFWIVGIKEAAWPRYLLDDPRVALCIDATDPLRRVVCQGHAHLVEEPGAGERWIEVARRMQRRYLGSTSAAGNRATPAIERWLFSIAPTTLRTWQGPGRHEPDAEGATG